MAKTIKLEVITPSKLFYKGDAEMVVVRTLTGEEGFMADHAWACKLLDVGVMCIHMPGEPEPKLAAIAGGYIDVKENIVLYTDAAEWAEEIDIERAMSAKAIAEEWLSSHTATPDVDPNEIARAKISLAKQLTRMNVAQGGARRKR